MDGVKSLGDLPVLPEVEVRQKSPREVAVTEVALEVIKKLVLSLAVNGLMWSAGVNPFSVMIFTVSIGAVLVDCFVYFIATRSLIGSGEVRFSRMNRLADLSLINLLGLAGPSYLIHETGHAIAASCCLKNAAPKIHAQAFIGGFTKFVTTDGLSSLGCMLGQRGTVVLITAAGGMATTIWALVEFAIAYFTEESHPTLSEFLRCQGISQLLNEICYGLGTFITDPGLLSHDYVRLERVGGIHPLVPVALMILLPVAEHLILRRIWAKENPEKAAAGRAPQAHELPPVMKTEVDSHPQWELSLV